MERDFIQKAKRVVVKVGTSSITYPGGKINLSRMDELSRQVSCLRNSGREPILISSGAVGAGMGKLNRPESPVSLPEKQALAAVGQGLLMGMYEKFFAEYSQSVAQVLLTRDCFADSSRYLYSRNTLFALLDMGVIPIINENDTIAVDELRFGDNDTLSAMVACSADADLLIILSDIDGLYNSNPRADPDAELIPVVTEITAEMERNSHTKGSGISSGGMFTKLAAARVTMANGIPMIIANSSEKDIIMRAAGGENIGTLFLPRRDSYESSHRRWISAGSATKGAVVVDRGAEDAILNKGTNLFTSGVLEIRGSFAHGDAVSVLSESGVVIARGITNYGSGDAKKIIGKHSSEIKGILGFADYEELIHRRNIAILV